MAFRLSLFAGLALSSALAGQMAGAEEIYKWVDENGNVHFTDQATSGADKVEIKPITTIPAIKVPPSDNNSKSKDIATPVTVTINSPANDSAFHSVEGNLHANVSVKPALANGQILKLKVNGKEVSSGNATSIQIENLERGTHTFSAEITDKSGAVVASDLSTFTIHKPTAKKPAPR
ncbi:MAG: DUF4124 domain-containing protein [Hahellaceae bacterium]|nr:DUF4124 domain-containing protein [Hahellaceae bacterium]MCP5210543.1 DUF4124 domain-containing protein [Hahellaceae bacterium]